jgi:hypothetical protein
MFKIAECQCRPCRLHLRLPEVTNITSDGKQGYVEGQLVAVAVAVEEEEEREEEDMSSASPIFTSIFADVCVKVCVANGTAGWSADN